jgi:hypothetical protein
MKKVLEDSGRFHVAVSSNLKPGDKPGMITGTVPFPPDLSKYDVVLSNYNGADWPKDFQKRKMFGCASVRPRQQGTPLSLKAPV